MCRTRKSTFKPALLSILLANGQSLVSKVDELNARIMFQCDIRNCCVFAFTETWLDVSITDNGVSSPSFTIHRQHNYTTLKNIYKPLLRPAFGKADHILLLPAYKQKLKQEKTVIRTIKGIFTFPDCFQTTDWQIFRDASGTDIEE